jgi:hypothetical protein
LFATARLLQLLNKSHIQHQLSASQIIEQIIIEDEPIWSGSGLRYFALQLLSKESTVFLEPLPTLRLLVAHFLTPNSAQIYSAEQKLWLGLALGRISNEAPFYRAEYKSTPAVGGNHDNVAISSTNAVLTEMFQVMRSEGKISGLLEQALRDLTSDSTFKISPSFGADQLVLKYLKSPYVPMGVSVRIQRFLSLPPPSDILAWTTWNRDFATWHKALACSIAQDLPNNKLYATLVSSIDMSMGFCQSVFPYLVDEYRSQRRDGSLARIFNALLEASRAIDHEYLRLVIHTILFVRERPAVATKKKVEPLVDEINYLHAANAAVACRMYKTALMFLEIFEKRSSGSDAQFADQILSEIYRNIDDPDLTYALSQGVSRTWGQLLDVYQLHHDRGGVNGLRRARLRAKIELGATPAGDDDDLLAVADLVRQSGFSLNSLDISGGAGNENQERTSTASLYRSAWRLGNWDLPPSTRSWEPNKLIYSVLYQLTQKSIANDFFPVLQCSIIQLVDKLTVGVSSPENTNAVICLSMFADLSDLFSGSKSMITAGRGWAKQILRHAEYGRWISLFLN